MRAHLSLNLKVLNPLGSPLVKVSFGVSPGSPQSEQRAGAAAGAAIVAGACQIRLSALSGTACVFPACSNLHANGTEAGPASILPALLCHMP